ncbi:hypothetical protein T08_6201 [Trichinella sp. T8]|nr:hypothetical protein T08_6201 [Trichinella sp. T8]
MSHPELAKSIELTTRKLLLLNKYSLEKGVSLLLCVMYEGRVHLLRQTVGLPTVYTNLEVNTVLRSTPHSETCTADESVLYRIEKRNTLKRRAGEETKTVPQIYGEECSSASTSLETAGQFPTYKKVKAAMYRSRAKRFPPMQVVKKEPDVNCVFQVTTRQAYVSQYDRKTNCESPMGQFDPEDNGRFPLTQ